MSQSSTDSSRRRVVVTGIGLVSPLGIGVEAFWSRLSAGESGIARSQHMAYTAVPGHIGGEVVDFDENSAKKQWLKEVRKNVKVMCRDIQLGVASALLAVADAQVDPKSLRSERVGVEFGANLMLTPPDTLTTCAAKAIAEEDSSQGFRHDRWGMAGRNTGRPSGMGEMEPLWLLKYLPNMPACHISIALDARGPSNSITLDEASGNAALGEGHRIISRGKADVVVAGTTGARLHPMQSIHAAMWDELAQEDGPPETWCRPFDKHRTGQVVGEGACTFVLEEESHARSRGAKIYGEVLGFGSACVADRDGNPQHRRALVLAMQAALRDAGLSSDEVGHVNAHGLGSRAVDRAEAEALQDVFGSRGRTVPVTALKSYFGNAGPGCGTQELAGSLLALQHGVVPVTLNYRTPDADCPLNVVHGERLPTDNPVILKLNVTRMGQATALVVRAA